MAFTPTGYKPGRPRKGEIRPLTPAMTIRNKWKAANYELALEIQRESARKLKEHDPEYFDRAAKAYRLRKKGWGDIKLILTGHVIAIVGDDLITIVAHVD